MSNKSNTQGRAYEYACLISLKDEIEKACIRNNSSCTVIINENLPEIKNCKKAWDDLSQDNKNIYYISSEAAALQILELEPMLDCINESEIELRIQPDRKGIDGDVRDILIIRKSSKWEIGISVKHNSFAVKHSRVSRDIDFGESWFKDSCSEEYWKSIAPVFDLLEMYKNLNYEFNDIPDKITNIYQPALKAFIKETKRLLEEKPKNAANLVEYLLGKFDFYKLISVDSKKYTAVRAVNLNGTLNKPTEFRKSSFCITKAKLPTRMIYIGMLPSSNTTMELYLDNGWQFTFRIHNAEKMATPSLKFDIQIVGMPTAIVTFNCVWRKWE